MLKIIEGGVEEEKFNTFEKEIKCLHQGCMCNKNHTFFCYQLGFFLEMKFSSLADKKEL